jgi:hypothetical protein
MLDMELDTIPTDTLTSRAQIAAGVNPPLALALSTALAEPLTDAEVVSLGVLAAVEPFDEPSRFLAYIGGAQSIMWQPFTSLQATAARHLEEQQVVAAREDGLAYELTESGRERIVAALKGGTIIRLA